LLKPPGADFLKTLSDFYLTWSFSLHHVGKSSILIIMEQAATIPFLEKAFAFSNHPLFCLDPAVGDRLWKSA
jgi:hypothetical protein